MFNKKIFFHIVGRLLIIESFFIFLSALVSVIYKESDAIPIAGSAGITLLIGLTLILTFRKPKNNIGPREGYMVVGTVWVIFSVFGMLPFLLTESIPNVTDAFFETMSGFTTTGASILNNIEELSHGILFWRSITQWLGGMGIIVLSIAIMPQFGIGGMQLFVAEVPGLTPDKLHPRIKETAKRLWGIYVLFTLLETILLWAGDMNFFDAICHSFTTMATGGYSTKQASAAAFSPYAQYVMILFMFIAGTNFSLSYFAMTKQFDKVWKNEEFKFYLGFIVLFSVAITTGLYFSNYGSGESSFRDALFQVVSIITTTGFVTADYLAWTPLLGVLIFVLMFVGGSAGSTGGGVKIARIVLLLKNSMLELKRLIHPNAVIPVRINGRAVNPNIVANVLAFISFYILILIISIIVMSAVGCDLETSIGTVATSLGNIGPGIGSVGPMDNFANIPTFGKWFLSLLMLLGRLELFTVLIILSPGFWKK